MAGADRAVVPAIADPGKFAEDERLDPEQLVRDVVSLGGEAAYIPSVGEIARYVAMHAEEDDVVAVLSNGGFGGLHEMLLSTLGERH